jgi:flagellar hook-basal body complex protein FliE
MDVNLKGVGFISDVFLTPSPGTQNVSRTNSQVFEDFLAAAAGIYNETNTNLNALETMQLKIATGESDDFIGLTLMQTKATASMQFITQLTSRAVEAYREIMRMQV